MYIHMLQEHGISETVNTARFVTKLKESLPNLYSSRRKDGKTIVVFDQQVDNLIRDYVKTPDELSTPDEFERSFLQKKNSFDGHFEPANLSQCQKVFCEKAH